MSPELQRVVAWLGEGKTLTAKWDAGGDETLVSLYVDGKQLSFNSEHFFAICDVIADQLELPNAGEWFVKGGGTIRREANQIVIDHESTGFGYGWDPETDREFEIDEESIVGTDVLWQLN